MADIISDTETHASLDSLFMYADAPGDPPEGSKHVKALEWLRRTNKDDASNPLDVAGRLIETYMEVVVEDPDAPLPYETLSVERKNKIQKALDRASLNYIPGGRISSGASLPSISLLEHIRRRDFKAIDMEFDRAIKNTGSNPREAVSAACNILESVCKTYIEEEHLTMPKKQDLNGVWNVVRKDLGIDPSNIGDRDLQEIMTGIFATISGIGALRTHTSSAHGSGNKIYKLQGRHVRLAVNSAHTLALFILESWQEKNAAN
ncbi:MAG: abortive infection family protein [Kordiimonadaceae bacterium]|nr:abortive infection family protein [Kordiimonadaceae bacterium]